MIPSPLAKTACLEKAVKNPRPDIHLTSADGKIARTPVEHEIEASGEPAVPVTPPHLGIYDENSVD